MTVPLFESGGAAGPAGEPQVTTMTAPSTTSSQSGTSGQPAVGVQLGGGQGKPVVYVGSVALGYEDVLIMLILVQALLTVYMGVSD